MIPNGTAHMTASSTAPSGPPRARYRRLASQAPTTMPVRIAIA